MCYQREIELKSSNEAVNEFIEEERIRESDFMAPVNRVVADVYDLKRIIACSTCFFPIAFERDLRCLIKDHENRLLGIVVPNIHLFDRVRTTNAHSVQQWQTEAFCPVCDAILSFWWTNPDFEEASPSLVNIFLYLSEGNCAILSPAHVIDGTVEVIHSRFIEANRYRNFF